MRDKVKRGYGEGNYLEDFRSARDIRDPEIELLEKLIGNSDESSRVLDLGCGNGIPFDRFLVDQGIDVLGVDIAENHVEEARKLVPKAEFVQGDFFEQEFDEEFEAIISLYAIFHIPREQHKDLFEKLNTWIADSGRILVTVATEEMEKDSSEFAGSELVWSSYSPEKSKKMITESGFEIIETYEENVGDENHLWILAEESK